MKDYSSAERLFQSPVYLRECHSLHSSFVQLSCNTYGEKKLRAITYEVYSPGAQATKTEIHHNTIKYFLFLIPSHYINRYAV